MESNVFHIELPPPRHDDSVCFAVMCLEDSLSGPGKARPSNCDVAWNFYRPRPAYLRSKAITPAIQSEIFCSLPRINFSVPSRDCFLCSPERGAQKVESDYRGTQTLIINSIKANKKDIKLKQFLSVPKRSLSMPLFLHGEAQKSLRKLIELSRMTKRCRHSLNAWPYVGGIWEWCRLKA